MNATTAPRDELAARAARAGIEVDWIDALGVARRVPDETLAALVERVGGRAATAAPPADAADSRGGADHARPAPPLVTADSARPIALPAAVAPRGGAFRIELEMGGVVDGNADAPQKAWISLPGVAAPGYHRLEIGDAQIALAVAPSRCYAIRDAWAERGASPPLFGAIAQLYGLRQAGDGGIGHYGALAALAAVCGRHGAQALGVSPTHALASALPQHFSPYSPSSRRWLNVAYLDPASAWGEAAFRAALEHAGAAERWAALEAAPFVDWPAIVPLKLRVLRALFERAGPCVDGEHDDTDLAGFEVEMGRALDDHARFEALHAHCIATGLGARHRDWPSGWRDGRSADVDAFAQARADDVAFHRFLQWLAHRQLVNAQRAARDAGMRIGLVADLAVGCDPDGSDAWSAPDAMLGGVSIGAPPDAFNRGGQAWGLTTYAPHALRSLGFAPFIALLRAAFAHAGGVRIDHVLGLMRLWVVPDGRPPADGAYLRYPLDDLLRIVALESWRHRAIVIGEDLGTVPAGFSAQLAARGIAGTRVLWFERGRDGAFKSPDAWDADAVATTSTHDLPTVAGWWSERDLEWRMRDTQPDDASRARDSAQRDADRAKLWAALGRAGVTAAGAPPPASVAPPVDAALAFVASTGARLALFPLEDLLGLGEQPNLPGPQGAHPNWRRRLARSVEATFDAPAVKARLRAIVRARLRVARRMRRASPDTR
ncbi:4-alpha-glucanotransferase [Burkholderia mayonis]|uniref:4-alpha-glucanotransferase n=1 Tax=Burkholderia mayonis TaxID=1385591 RepID=A0A1B4FWS2_9BURK|nr:4-alpha-glucanotransferase [Burkholderia mayonis]AOJ08120.1 hypothetical protein WS71_05975 [Burkholderia mayonis]KVE59039.1 hypothetical protein WS71_01125 [Burkholderia mayonis]